MIPRLGDSPDSPFPPLEAALEEPDGLLAWGGDLHPQRLLRAYREGIFPWYSDNDPILWWSPSVRCVFRTGKLHISRRLARVLRQGRYRLSADRDFEAVIDNCSRLRTETWITPEMRAAYLELHDLGHAHSIEVWDEGGLAGGLYGLSIGRVFFGESMYSARRDASKVALCELCRVLQGWGFPLLDGQLTNPHLLRMGAELMLRARFRAEILPLLNEPAPAGAWTEVFESAL